ncbi:hypothetical protein [Clostridium folliculivorans]|uniref:WxL domain-containing protein n=1 Tax=Clostridium folliculivorans TaxID=2886038 RepID=A0A9W5Y568_9CLOT|nr:hypothetical protein [Clostridium folliculivorans]GKU26794.1 hypothetical protein CFOLD11_36210 [Clostridium folliculivorans]GKU31388.1 hypothetical protein CFB3_34950 [Clostridium folliculivorans]
MLFTKQKKIIIGLTAATVMSLGGVTAFAASNGVTLTPAAHVDISKIDAKLGTYKVVDGATINISGGENAKTEANVSLTAVPGNLDLTHVEKGTATVVRQLTPEEIAKFSGNNTTAAK